MMINDLSEEEKQRKIMERSFLAATTEIVRILLSGDEDSIKDAKRMFALIVELERMRIER